MGSLKGGAESTSSVPAFVTDGGKFGVDRSKQLAEMGYMPYFGPDVAALSPMEYSGIQNTAGAANAFGMASPGLMDAATGGSQRSGQGGLMHATGQYKVANVGDSEKAQFVNDMYQTQLGRAPDQAGYDYYMSKDINMDNPEAFKQGFNQGIPQDPLTGLPAAGNYGGMAGYSSGPMYQGALDELQRRRPGQFAAYEGMFIDPQTGASPSGLGNETAPASGQPWMSPKERQAREWARTVYGDESYWQNWGK
ncbi:DUF4214 domain-containing protein [Roseovarius sp. SK2]|uniref:DUF4214 domain-containing protein n=1 Tax=Roseovarius TaxID=74030 RepID=UPI00237C0A43|nr:DUF4214 domain-containing protein [Roseovarius sp. SK2]MDD9727229.1 DUF4214 domain-containing protein [Roseovarius sp. SK2]